MEQLMAETRRRTRSLFQHGTTTAEAKTGYGLETATELRQLEVLLTLDAEGPLEIAPTFLGAHAIPLAYKAAPDDYTHWLCHNMLPDVAAWWQARYPQLRLPFVDVFCDQGAFNLQQARCILEAARAFGFPLKLHADEFESLGATALAVDLAAVSADHLVNTLPPQSSGWRRAARWPSACPALPLAWVTHITRQPRRS